MEPPIIDPSIIGFAQRMMELIEIKLDFKLKNLENRNRRSIDNLKQLKKNMIYTQGRLNIKVRSKSRGMSIENHDSRFFQKLARMSKTPRKSSSKILKANLDLNREKIIYWKINPKNG